MNELATCELTPCELSSCYYELMVIDFSRKTQLRQFELIVEGRSLYVNRYFLAEISPYFYTLCFSETFEESKQGYAELDDVSYDDMVILLQSICPDDFVPGPKITAQNFAILIHLSNRLLLVNLRHQLNEILKGDLLMLQMLPYAMLVEIVYEAMVAQFSESSISSLCRRVAKFDENEFTRVRNGRLLLSSSMQQKQSGHFISWTFFVLSDLEQ